MAINAASRSQHLRATGTHAERTDVLVICNDDSLLIELGPLLGDHYRVHAIDTLANIGGQADLAHLIGWIGIVDVDSQIGARDAVSRLELQHANCPLIVITGRPEQWADSTARGTVLAAIGRDQVAAAPLSDALLAAENRLRADGLETLAATARNARPDRFAVRLQRRGAIWASAAVLLVLLVLLGATGGWLYHGHRSPVRGVTDGAASTTAASATIATRAGTASATAGLPASPDVARPPAPPQQSVLPLLSAARIAFRDQRLLPPRSAADVHGDSALELYVRVLSQDPQDDEALAGVKRLLVIGGQRIIADAASGELDDANRLLALFKAAAVSAGDLQPLVRAVSAARPGWLTQRAAQSIAAGDLHTAEQLLAAAAAGGADADTLRTLRTQAAAKRLKLQLTGMAAQVNRAIQAGALLPPAGDNAFAGLSDMRVIARSHPLTLQTQYEVQTALVQAGEQATRAAQFALAQRDLDAAAELGSFAPLGYARGQLQEARAATARSAAVTAPAARPRVVDTRALAPAPGSPAQVSTPSRAYIAAEPTRALPVSYPNGANASGTVIVEFTLSAKGSASDVTVVQSDLPRVFDRMAISAVRHGRYSTRELVDGQPARARIKLRFNPD